MRTIALAAAAIAATALIFVGGSDLGAFVAARVGLAYAGLLLVIAAGLPALLALAGARWRPGAAVTLGVAAAILGSGFGLRLVLHAAVLSGFSHTMSHRLAGAALALGACSSPFVVLGAVALSRVERSKRALLLGPLPMVLTRAFEMALQLLVFIAILYALRHALASLGVPLRAGAAIALGLVAFEAVNAAHWTMYLLVRIVPPDALGAAAERVHELVGADLRLWCLGRPFSQSRACQVEIDPVFRSHLVLSPDLVALLGRDELEAILVHEAAHVLGTDVLKRIAVSTVIGWAGVAALLAALRGHAGLDTLMMAAIVYTILQRAIDNAYSRRQERKADLLAVATVGADALVAALKVTAEPPPEKPGDWSFLTTHDSWQRRRRQALIAASRNVDD